MGYTRPSLHHLGHHLILFGAHVLVSFDTLCFMVMIVPWGHASEGYVTLPSPTMCYPMSPSHRSGDLLVITLETQVQN